MAFRSPGTAPDTPGWRVRVIPNKFSAVSLENSLVTKKQGIYEKQRGFGGQEVVIETPVHARDLKDEDETQIKEVLLAWQERFRWWQQNPNIKYVQIFKNVGVAAGASLEHAHSQLTALPHVPPAIKRKVATFRKEKECLFCTLLRQEKAEKKRLVFQKNGFLLFTPFAARFPFEVCLAPGTHTTHFTQVSKEESGALAQALSLALKKLFLVLGPHSYNLLLHTAPVNLGDSVPFHWHLEIIPRLTTLAGFELGTGNYINPTPPELAAWYLRKEKAYK